MGDRLIVPKIIQTLALAAGIGTVAACGDMPAPTGPTLRSTPSFAAAGQSPVKSIAGLEPLLDAGNNVSNALDINDLGVVVGQSSAGASGVHAVVWEGGSAFPRDLGSLGGQSSAEAIAPDGSVIVGLSGGAVGGQFAVRWIRVNDTWVIDALPEAAGMSACFASDVASNGWIVGGCLIGADPHAVLWRNGIASDLGAGNAVAINANNQIVVNRPEGFPEILDFRTNPMTPKQLGKVGNKFTRASGINDGGDVAIDVLGGLNDIRPYVWSAKKGFVPLPSTLGDMVTSGINNAGNVIGKTIAEPPAIRSVYWTNNKKSYELAVLPPYSGAIASAISSSSRIVGASYLTGSDIRATVWIVK
jgi:probable HAF family extracellular repeat protein